MHRNRLVFYAMHSAAKPANFFAGYAFGAFGLFAGFLGFLLVWSIEFTADVYYWKNFDHATGGIGKRLRSPVEAPNHKNGKKRFSLAVVVLGIWAATGIVSALFGLGDFERFRTEGGIFAGYALAYYFHAERAK